MRAFALTNFDQQPEIADIAIPEPLEGEVRVRVRAASVNGFDLAVANGFLKGMMEHEFPVVLGKDFAGEIDAVGAGVESFSIGDRVFGVVTKATLGSGSIGEYVTVPASVGIAPLPQSIEFTEAAGLGLAGTAAVDSFDAATVTQGHIVLVAGATGGVGQQTVQLAAHAGATVIATAASPAEIELVTRLGAQHTVDYSGDVAAQVTALFPAGVDSILHFAGDPQALITIVKNGGKFVSTILQSADHVSGEGVAVVTIYAHPSRDTLERLARMQHEKLTKVTVQNVYALENASDAFSDFAAGTLGKLVIKIK